MATTGERATGTITIEYNTVTVTPIRDCPDVRGVRICGHEQYPGDLQTRRTAYVGNLESSDGPC